MPRRYSNKTPSAEPRQPSGPFIVLNPRGIPKGRHIISYPGQCVNCKDPHKGHLKKPCKKGYKPEKVDHWYEGDVWTPHEDSDAASLLRRGFIKEGKPVESEVANG